MRNIFLSLSPSDWHQNALDLLNQTEDMDHFVEKKIATISIYIFSTFVSVLAGTKEAVRVTVMFPIALVITPIALQTLKIYPRPSLVEKVKWLPTASSTIAILGVTTLYALSAIAATGGLVLEVICIREEIKITRKALNLFQILIVSLYIKEKYSEPMLAISARENTPSNSTNAKERKSPKVKTKKEGAEEKIGPEKKGSSLTTGKTEKKARDSSLTEGQEVKKKKKEKKTKSDSLTKVKKKVRKKKDNKKAHPKKPKMTPMLNIGPLEPTQFIKESRTSPRNQLPPPLERLVPFYDTGNWSSDPRRVKSAPPSTQREPSQIKPPLKRSKTSPNLRGSITKRTSESPSLTPSPRQNSSESSPATPRTNLLNTVDGLFNDLKKLLVEDQENHDDKKKGE